MSSSEIYVWINSSDLMQYLLNLPKYAETQIIKDYHSQLTQDQYCIMCKIVKSIDLSKFQPRFNNGYLFISCSDIKGLTDNGFIPECIFIPVFEQPKIVTPEPLTPEPYIFKAPNPYKYYSSTDESPLRCSIEITNFTDEKLKKERLEAELMVREIEMKERELTISRREAKCMHLKSICEDKSSILFGLIHMAYISCVHYYGPNAIHKAPGAIYSDIIDNIMKCGRFMNQKVSTISAIIDAIGEVDSYQKLISDCRELTIMWKDIETWIKGYCADFPKIFDELVPKMFGYIEYFQKFAVIFNEAQIIVDEPLSADGLIDQFIKQNKRF